jgi:hypothetical protein
LSVSIFDDDVVIVIIIIVDEFDEEISAPSNAFPNGPSGMDVKDRPRHGRNKSESILVLIP